MNIKLDHKVKCYQNVFTLKSTVILCFFCQVDGLWFYLPFDHHDGRVKVRQSGYAALLETDFGLRVSFIWGWRVDLHLPSSYYGVVCGLCGNFNDPHYRTFDGFHFDFQGTCVYQLAALCIDNTSLVPFNVTVKNDHRLSHAVSFTHTVNVTVNGFTITLTREHPYRLLVSTVTQYTLIGLRTILVTFDWSNVVSVTLPSNYSGAVCGLCGNFNGVVQDDFTMHNGMIAPNASSLGQSWQVAAAPGCSSADETAITPVSNHLSEIILKC
uniref:VWFD domain-containing protein n=1 Tax=Cyprinus carpio carpio TaxID=630221 RepID=A0A9J8AAS9_CYPCA